MLRVSVYQDLDKFKERVEERTKKLKAVLQEGTSPDRIEQFSKQLNEAVNSTGNGHDLCNYLEVLRVTKNASPICLEEKLGDDEFLMLLYKTLESWGMNWGTEKGGPRMKSPEKFKSAVKFHRKLFVKLAQKIQMTQEKDIVEFQHLERDVKELYDALHVMKTHSKLVANSKLMHFVLPHFIMPIDKTYTIKFLSTPDVDGSNEELEWEAFKTIHIWASEFAKKHKDQLKKLVEIDEKTGGWNQTIPKAIDNLIIYCKKHPEKCNRKR